MGADNNEKEEDYMTFVICFNMHHRCKGLSGMIFYNSPAQTALIERDRSFGAGESSNSSPERYDGFVGEDRSKKVQELKVALLHEIGPHIDVSLTCEHDPKLQEYCVCPQNMPQFDSEGIPNQAPETNKPMILNGPTSINREGSDQADRSRLVPVAWQQWSEMEALIPSPNACEVRSVIKFFNAQSIAPIEIHRQLCQVNGPNITSKQMVRSWCRQFSEGRQSVHDEERSGRPSLINGDRVELVRQCIKENRRFTITELSNHFPQISRSLLHEIVTKHLLFKKCVPAAVNALAALWISGQDEIQTDTVGTESDVHGVLGRKGILLIDFLPRGETVNADRYCETLRKLRRAIQNKRRGMLTAGVVLLQDNDRPHTARRTAAVFKEFGWELFHHPPYSPDLAPNDFHVFLHLKKFQSSGERFGNDEELKTSVTRWFHSTTEGYKS
ncbi:hypothetical protein ANN_23711 [Periplaneta americana]|uniref:Histone-lysine N-methyltransferase SETMAR n=1 Tax=Periplaneta americana TaxID=6978 RepID=A0ABQ8SNX2_PERAM|nr:hypothetical protein ANN_23711 [Periplaneta americana]